MSASADLICVPPHLIPQVWPLVADRLRAAFLKTDLSHTLDLECDVAEGQAQLWIAHDGPAIKAAATTKLVRTDRHLVCLLTACGGESRDCWLVLLEQIEAWAKAEGAELVRIIGRKGWVRVLHNYHVSNVVLERHL